MIHEATQYSLHQSPWEKVLSDLHSKNSCDSLAQSILSHRQCAPTEMDSLSLSPSAVKILWAKTVTFPFANVYTVDGQLQKFLSFVGIFHS